MTLTVFVVFVLTFFASLSRLQRWRVRYVTVSRHHIRRRRRAVHRVRPESPVIFLMMMMMFGLKFVRVESVLYERIQRGTRSWSRIKGTGIDQLSIAQIKHLRSSRSV